MLTMPILVTPFAAPADGAVPGLAPPGACASETMEKIMLSARLRAKMCNFDLPNIGIVDSFNPLLIHSSRRIWCNCSQDAANCREDEWFDYRLWFPLPSNAALLKTLC